MEFFCNFAPIVVCSNLVSKLLKIGEKLLKIPFSFLQLDKNAQKAILWSRIHFSSFERNFRKTRKNPKTSEITSKMSPFFGFICHVCIYECYTSIIGTGGGLIPPRMTLKTAADAEDQ